MCESDESFCSSGMASMNRTIAASLGKIETTLVRRLIARSSRSTGLVLAAA